MTMKRADGGGHLDDGALLRAIDGQLGADERASVESHLASCRECADARDGLVRIAGRVTAVLDATMAAPDILPRPTARAVPPRQPARGRAGRRAAR